MKDTETIPCISQDSRDHLAHRYEIIHDAWCEKCKKTVIVDDKLRCKECKSLSWEACAREHLIKAIKAWH